MLTLALKRSEILSFEKSLSGYIKKNYSEKPKMYTEDFSILENARKDATGGEISLSAVTNLHRYYEYLKKVQVKFPIDESNIKISFPWYNSLPNDKRLVTSFNLNFEKAALLYNIAVIYYHLGSNEIVMQPNVACDYFTKAAGMFKMLQDEFSGNLSIPPTCDLSPSSIHSLMKLMLAYAQECFIIKATLQAKEGVIVKLFASCGDFYNSALDSLLNQPVCHSFGQGWVSELQVKSLYFFAMAHYKKSMENLNGRKYGEQISRLTCALDLTQQALTLQKHLTPELLGDMKRINNDIQVALKAATKDNDLIYHDLIPKVETLPSLPRAEMVAPKFPLTDPISTVKIFATLVPLVLQIAVNSYKDRSSKVAASVKKEFAGIEQDIQSELAKLKLPGSIDAAEKPKGIPESVLKKAKELRDLNGASYLEASLIEMNTLGSRVQTLLEDINASLEAEASEDEEARGAFKSKWNRPASSEANEKLHRLLAKYSVTIQEARNSDNTVKKRYEAYIPSITHLCSSEAELGSMIPNCSSTSPKVANPAIEALRTLLGELDMLRNKARGWLSSLQPLLESDETLNLLLSVPPNSNFEPIFDQGLQKYETTRSQLSGCKQSCTKILDQIKTENANFTENLKASPGMKEREFALQALEEGYQNFKTLSANFKEGNSFYQDVTRLLVQLKSDTDDFVASRRIEAKDLLKGFQNPATVTKALEQDMQALNIASRNMADQPAPTVPFYHPPQPSAPLADLATQGPSMGPPPAHCMPKYHDGYAQPMPPSSYYYQPMPSQPHSWSQHGAWTPGLPVQYAHAPSSSQGGAPPQVPRKPSSLANPSPQHDPNAPQQPPNGSPYY